MRQEKIATGKTVDAAKANGAAALGVEPERVECEVIENPKKGFLGFGETLAKVRVIYTPQPEDNALVFLKKLFENLGLDAHIDISKDHAPSAAFGGDRLIKITGTDTGMLIGHHGDTLDSLQCLVNLAANKREDDGEGTGEGAVYSRIIIDIEDYRVKREDTLRRLARNIAARVLKYKKSITLEPMNPYERRIIHSEIQNVAGVSTTSVGVDNNRKVVVFADDKPRGSYNKKRFANNTPKPETVKTEATEGDDK
jgi:spoIIIJ-associated protein